jgi:geranylgeranyl diphosphate synthase type II
MDFEGRQDVSLSEYLHMIEQKTAALLSVSLRLGGIIANADDKRLKQLHELGITLGIAFQIQDDYLDVYGNPETFGKRKAGDLHEAKKTWLTIHALEQLQHDDANELSTILYKSERSSIDIDRIYQLFDKLELQTQVKNNITSYYEKAESLLTSFSDGPHKDHLKTLLTNLTDRNQ